jgi:hypothetical protein
MYKSQGVNFTNQNDMGIHSQERMYQSNPQFRSNSQKRTGGNGTSKSTKILEPLFPNNPNGPLSEEGNTPDNLNPGS